MASIPQNTTTKVRFDFSSRHNVTSTFYHDLPTVIVRSSHMAMTAAYRQAYFQAMGPIMRQHEAHCIAASEARCVVCGVRFKKSVIMMPISYLHLKDEPGVSVIVTPVCEVTHCLSVARSIVNDLVNEIADATMKRNAEGKGHGQQSPARNAHCHCGSSRKYKKCCGSETAMDDVD